MKPLFALAMGVLLFSGASAQIQINASYLNVTRPGGGPVVTGDVLEIHAVIAIPSGTSISVLSFAGTGPTNASYVPGTMSVRTNEDAVVGTVSNTGNYTDASGDDRGTYTSATNNMMIYMGDAAGATTGGSVTGGTTQPRFYNVATIFMVVYQVTVTGAAGTTVTTGGQFNYKKSSTAYHTAVPALNLLVSSLIGCGTMGSTNYLTDETNGTFGSGTTQTRGTSSNVTGYTQATLGANNPADGQYSIVNNTSATDYSGATPAGSDKVFSVWDVTGDHTGTSNGAGNSPTASGSSGGYLLAVNGTYVPATVFHTLVNVTANNSYTVSFWVRNICPTCGCDPATGNQNSTPGVLPNLTVSLNGQSYYSSGNISYTGTWVQKSYVFANIPGSTATIDITNNAPGGGGNDWVMDDITVNQCLIVLPVGLEYFTGHSGSQGALLRWKTSWSADIQQFNIERSSDGSHFFPIGQVPSNPDTTTYSYTDQLLPAEGGTFYYRLQILDQNGRPSYSPVVRVTTGNSTGNLITHLAPNPTHGAATLSIRGADAGTAQVTVWNAAGALVWSKETGLSSGTNTAELRLPEQLPRGIYLVKTTMGDASSVARLVIE